MDKPADDHTPHGDQGHAGNGHTAPNGSSNGHGAKEHGANGHGTNMFGRVRSRYSLGRSTASVPLSEEAALHAPVVRGPALHTPEGGTLTEVLGGGPMPVVPRRGITRIDAHCHSWASDGPVIAAAGLIGCPECYSPPEKVYDQARARGMDLVTITDHDTIKGAMELIERGFQGMIVGQEVSVRFPEDKCLLHVLVWGLTPELDEEITREELRYDVYKFAAWLRQHDLPHALAHPLYVQNGKLTHWHVERCALLFKNFEALNGAHSEHQSSVLVRYLNTLTPGVIHRLSEEHQMEPVWPRAWEKGRTGGSDDHALLNVGRTWTEVYNADGTTITDPREFFRRVMSSESDSGGVGGHSALLAHQISTVGANYFARRLYERRSPGGKYISAKLLKFFGVDVKSPSKKRVAAYKLSQKVAFPRKGKKRKKDLPLVRALKTEIGPVLERYPDLRERLKPENWDAGTAVGEHDRMADFMEEIGAALSRAMGTKAVKAFKKRDAGRIAEYVVSYAILHLAQAPYLFSLFHQNKERNFLDRFEHEASPPGSGMSVLERPMRISLFTDTLGDVNGVSRFITNVADASLETGRDLQVITSTRMQCPELSNIHNFAPTFATKIPRYENLELVLPPLMRILRHVDRHQPDVIHISTPGPVGCIGFIAAKMLRVPVLGVYHTDFPAYVDQLFDDYAMTSGCKKFMKAFYKPFSAIFTRSDDYKNALVKLGLDGDRVVRLMPGFENAQFSPELRDTSIWPALGAGRETVKVLYVGRVSIEKNLPMLTKLWPKIEKACAQRGVDAELVVVGDGPYREQMASELAGKRVAFLGFRYGQELSRIYASSDLFVFPSVTDTLGQVVMESQGSGLPVIVTNVGGPKEVVGEGRTGYVLGADDTQGWVDRVSELVCDGDRRRVMGAAAYESMGEYSLSGSFDHFWQVHVRAWHEHLHRSGITPETAGSRAEMPVGEPAAASTPAVEMSGEGV